MESRQMFFRNMPETMIQELIPHIGDRFTFITARNNMSKQNYFYLVSTFVVLD